MARVFVTDGDPRDAVRVREAASADGHEVEVIADPSELRRRLPDEDSAALALVLTGDPGTRDAERCAEIMAARIPRPPVLAVVEEADREVRRELGARLGIDEVLQSPPDEAEVQVALATQLDRYELQLETGIVGRTEGIREALERISSLAQVSSTVLITGESGTGKELAARAIHRLSRRRGRPFIAVNCAAIPETLLESELFGHEKGSFTGATSRRKGVFELADGGTLLLDEIAEMPLALQTRLLRVLETRRFMRVGGDAEIEVDVRVLAATNRDLREDVQEGRFRRDLYYRLNVLHLELPPLRERKSDIPILVRRFVEEFSREHDREFKGLAPDAMRVLLDYEWPGNVRELRNLLESMVVLAPGALIRAEDIPPEIRTESGRALLPMRAGGGALEGTDGSAAARLPQMEFLFRTLVEMKIDLEDLRSEFERFRARAAEAQPESGRAAAREIVPIEIRARDLWGEPEGAASDEGAAGETASAEGEAVPVIPLSPGMTMADVEREAIAIALGEVEGNRRRAAERLGIGERTLYRKIKEYGIEG